MARLILLLAILWTALSLPACTARPIEEVVRIDRLFRPLVAAGPEEVDRLAALPYPAEIPLADARPRPDIIAVRDDDQLKLLNRTAYRYVDQQLWLNQQYVAEIEAIEIGVNRPLTLLRFVNEHREPFPVRQWLAPEAARPLVTAELYDPVEGVRRQVVVQPPIEF